MNYPSTVKHYTPLISLIKLTTMENGSSTLHCSQVHTTQASITKLFTFFYSTLLFSFISFRLNLLTHPFTLPCLLLSSAELLLAFLSLLNLSFRWRPLSRAAFPDRLAGAGAALPAIDVLVFTADPRREPPLEVMNTIISAMALDYPPERLAVYLSDDAGWPATLAAAKEAVAFARMWVPFCRKYGVATRCPNAYFAGDEVDDSAGVAFSPERKAMEESYETFKERIRMGHNSDTDATSDSRPPYIEIINPNFNDTTDKEEHLIPRLIYVAREKRPLHPHHFKAGAINTLLRVSSVITNAPYLLVLDCDMYSNDPSSARQAMCFLLDPEISPSLAFVQFPQKFHNAASDDIYGSNIQTTFEIKWPGMDGLNGPAVTGTCFYMKRRALYGSIPIEDADITKLRKHFGPSNELIKSLQSNNNGKINKSQTHPPSTFLAEAKFLASCEYEKNTSWGHEVGFLYGSVVEDYFTSFKLHCSGWKSVYCNPPRAAFLGTATTNLNDTLVQNTRWQSGLLDVTLSRRFPLVYGPMRMSLLQSLCYASLGLQPIFCLPIWCLAIVPQLCLIHGIALYPKASSPWFMILLACFLAPKLKYLQDMLTTGGTIQDWWNEERIWAIRSVTSFLYGTIDAVLKKAGLRQASFTPTNKVDGDENVKLYKMGKFNFRVSPMFLVPLTSITLLNAVAFVVGVMKVVMGYSPDGWDELLAQILLTCYVLVLSYPLIEGMFVRKDTGRIRGSVVMTSALFSLGILGFGSVLLVGLKWI